ncbi:tumor necrosis factor receptor superfamily member 25 [Indicator indicator]|uniref:tumor necrosis factor receptor superfamily member 25 n=1 Tax=Indicator indicator TaxID=1002788 RepID=UPI0023DF9212|nr:tumor necrosis factor receptor superfamily member 25 [Indicator indicator]
MKHCCPGVAWVILAVLWLALSEPQTPPCQDRHATRRPCPAGMNWVKEACGCCTQCPAGESCLASVSWHGQYSIVQHAMAHWTTGAHVPCHPAVPAGTFLYKPCSSLGNDSVCKTCSPGTFRAQPNTFTKCQACYECDQQAFQSVLSNCSATSNVACGCRPGHFRSCLDEQCTEFSCLQCQTCAGRLVQRPCSETQDTLCGSCKPDFYTEGGECRPCPTTTPDACGKECQRACSGSDSNSQGSGLEYILLAFTGPLFLGALAIYHKRKQLWHSTSSGSPHPTVQAANPTAWAMPLYQDSAQVGDSICWTQSCSSQVTKLAAGMGRQSPKHDALLQKPGGTAWPGGEVGPSSPLEPRATLLQGSQLYSIIDAVPVRRWKEFMRVLELREAEIELVELEVAHVRDQQYEMLKRWCQQTSATLDHVFTALERMELSGCAEALRRSLLVGP